MNERTCTDTRPCNLTTCYPCRVRLIDATAARLTGTVGKELAAGYRATALRQLAFEVDPNPPVTEPKRKPARGFTPAPGVNYQGIADKLKTAPDRGEAAWLIVGRTIAELKHIGKLAGYALPGRVKADVREALIHYTVDLRLGHRSIVNS